MPSAYMKDSPWALVASDEGAWTLEIQREDGRQQAIVAMRAAFPSRAAESIANGHLCKAAPAMYEALQTYMLNREWALSHGAGNGEFPQDMLHQFAAMQRDLHEEVVAALAEAEGQEVASASTAY